MPKPKLTQNKRLRERAKREKQQRKQARRLESQQKSASQPRGAGGEDPDIAGIVPGPQPLPWDDDEAVEAEE